jgi:LPS-assembly lipoprotein
VEVIFVDGRVGDEVRNDLIFSLTGGAGNPAGAPYKLVLDVRSTTSQASVVSPLTGLPEVELVSVDVSWKLFEAGNMKAPLKTGRATGKASLDSGYQRFARARAIRDAENRSASVAAGTIKGQLASYFLTRAPNS